MKKGCILLKNGFKERKKEEACKTWMKMLRCLNKGENKAIFLQIDYTPFSAFKRKNIVHSSYSFPSPVTSLIDSFDHE